MKNISIDTQNFIAGYFDQSCNKYETSECRYQYSFSLL